MVAKWSPFHSAGKDKVPMRHVFCVICLLFFFTGGAFAEVKRFQIPLENSPSIGPENAAVTIVEFIDYQ